MHNAHQNDHPGRRGHGQNKGHHPAAESERLFGTNLTSKICTKHLQLLAGRHQEQLGVHSCLVILFDDAWSLDIICVW